MVNYNMNSDENYEDNGDRRKPNWLRKTRSHIGNGFRNIFKKEDTPRVQEANPEEYYNIPQQPYSGNYPPDVEPEQPRQRLPPEEIEDTTWVQYMTDWAKVFDLQFRRIASYLYSPEGRELEPKNQEDRDTINEQKRQTKLRTDLYRKMVNRKIIIDKNFNWFDSELVILKHQRSQSDAIIPMLESDYDEVPGWQIKPGDSTFEGTGKLCQELRCSSPTTFSAQNSARNELNLCGMKLRKVQEEKHDCLKSKEQLTYELANSRKHPYQQEYSPRESREWSPPPRENPPQPHSSQHNTLQPYSDPYTLQPYSDPYEQRQPQQQRHQQPQEQFINQEVARRVEHIRLQVAPEPYVQKKLDSPPKISPKTPLLHREPDLDVLLEGISFTNPIAMLYQTLLIPVKISNKDSKFWNGQAPVVWLRWFMALGALCTSFYILAQLFSIFSWLLKVGKMYVEDSIKIRRNREYTEEKENKGYFWQKKKPDTDLETNPKWLSVIKDIRGGGIVQKTNKEELLRAMDPVFILIHMEKIKIHMKNILMDKTVGSIKFPINKKLLVHLALAAATVGSPLVSPTQAIQQQRQSPEIYKISQRTKLRPSSIQIKTGDKIIHFTSLAEKESTVILQKSFKTRPVKIRSLNMAKKKRYSRMKMVRFSDLPPLTNYDFEEIETKPTNIYTSKIKISN
jgi:hypothetical protein